MSGAFERAHPLMYDPGSLGSRRSPAKNEERRDRGRVSRPLLQSAKRFARQAVRSRGYDLVRWHPSSELSPELDRPLPDMDDATAATWAAVRPYTLTSAERVAVLCDSVRYVERACVPGAYVECGVWRGGSVLAMIRTLLDIGVRDREFYLYDTFTAMPEPDPVDVDCYGSSAADQQEWLRQGGAIPENHAYLPFDAVRALIDSTGYPMDRVHFIKGLVEETIPARSPDEIALLRLDTDYYKSTKHELDHLSPRLAPGGVLIVDDYGHWEGSRLATDEHVQQLGERGVHLFLQRIDYSGRLAVFPQQPPPQIGAGT
jgi:O-methyltransferase